MNPFSFQYETFESMRTGVITTPHGTIQTPSFVPVGTQATVKSLTPDELHSLGVQLFFVNTYHTYLRPGIDVIKQFGGLHAFSGWNKPIITDSGGFQVYSLAKPKYAPTERNEQQSTLVNIGEDGVGFRSHWDGTEHFFSPESSMEYQWGLGSDIHIAFDDCTPYPATRKQVRASLDRTHRWLVRSCAQHNTLATESQKGNKLYQALYGVVQGSVYEDFRIESANFVSRQDTDGIAIGGVSVGESKEEMRQVLTWVIPHLPVTKPRHLLGVGEIDDIFTLVENGCDTFDCVQPTRLARMGFLYQTNSVRQIDISKSVFAKDTGPIDPHCNCYTCVHFSRSYVHHLFHVRELLGYRLATIHNLAVIHTLVAEIRKAIVAGSFLDLKKRWLYNI